MKTKATKTESNEPIDPTAGYRVDSGGSVLTTNQGAPIADNQNSLRAGARGPSLLEDFILREKITHFDHERIPERVVHARGSAAHGYFQVYESMARYTKAKFLQNPSQRTPVFVRFSTVAGGAGSADTVRDVRGFAIKFYTEDGNYDLVGNNIPVFFIQDAMKFPDLIHAVKPEPHHGMPQAASAHDTFWDFVSVMPESMHMIMWAMSDRAIPRSLRMMQGFGIHTFRFVNAADEAHFVKFHFKPLLGTHSLVWDEAQKLCGKDSDFHRRDLWEAIENGDFAEFEMGVQLIPEADEDALGIDLLDATKLIPEELVPVTPVGRLVLNRNPDNFFAETEQVAFHPGHIVPGIDFTNDPLLQGRLFSYTDTQLIRLGGPNSHEIPINRAHCPVHNNQRDGFMRQTIGKGSVAYEPNVLGGGCPMQSPAGFVSYAAKVQGPKVRVRAESFGDHYSQATLFWRSQTAPEQGHLVAALAFELSKLETVAVRQRVTDMLQNVDRGLASRVAEKLGLELGSAPPKRDVAPIVERAPSLSMTSLAVESIKTRKIAMLITDGVNDQALGAISAALKEAGAQVKYLAPTLNPVSGASGKAHNVDLPISSASSVLFDAVVVPAGASGDAVLRLSEGVEFVQEAFKHYKTVALSKNAMKVLQQLGGDWNVATGAAGIVILEEDTDHAAAARKLVSQIAKHRHWSRTSTH